MKKSKNNNKQKYDKSNTQNKKQFRNRCLVSENNESQATNQEIIEEVESHVDKTSKIKKNKNLKENFEEKSEEDSKNNSDENNEDVEEEDKIMENDEENEEIPMSKEDFNIKLFMLV
jgi:hypothetical protein